MKGRCKNYVFSFTLDVGSQNCSVIETKHTAVLCSPFHIDKREWQMAYIFFLAIPSNVNFFVFNSSIRWKSVNQLSDVMLRPDPNNGAAILFTKSGGLLLTENGPSGCFPAYTSFKCVRHFASTGANSFMPYLVGLDGIYCLKEHLPLKPGSISSMVTFSLGE